MFVFVCCVLVRDSVYITILINVKEIAIYTVVLLGIIVIKMKNSQCLCISTEIYVEAGSVSFECFVLHNQTV